MSEQKSFRFSPLSGEVLNLGKMGLELNRRRMLRGARRRLVETVSGGSVAVSWDGRQYCDQAALLEEIRRQFRKRAREFRKALGGRKRKAAALVEIAKSTEGRRAQRIIDQLHQELGEFEARKRA